MCSLNNALEQSLQLLLASVISDKPLVTTSVATPIWQPRLNEAMPQARLASLNALHRLSGGASVNNPPNIGAVALRTSVRLAKFDGFICHTCNAA
jgi:hypothetical protein